VTDGGPLSPAGVPAGVSTRVGGPVVDAHVHVFSPDIIADRERYLGRDEWFRCLYTDPTSRMVTGDGVLEEMDATGVAVSVIFGFAFHDQGLCRETNDYVIELVKAHPDRFIGLACVSPEEPGAVTELERCLDAGLRGAGELFPDGQRFDLGESRALDAVALVLSAHCLPIMLHANEPVGHHYAGKGDNTPGPCFQFAQRHPDLTIVYAHMGGGLFFYELMPKVREALTNVYYDTAAVPYLYRPDVYALGAAVAGGQKLLFGSDYPLISPGRYLRDTESLDPALRKAIFSDNPLAVFGTGGVFGGDGVCT
jgi:predicted TIM-barrel fold metal-dependent hydrolase